MISNLIIVTILLIISTISKSIMDKLQFHYTGSIFLKFTHRKWWNPSNSWKNKYKNGKKEDGPKFFGSTTFLVFLTDAWHFFQSIFLTSLQLSILFAINIGLPFQWWYWFLGLLIIKILYGGIFELFFNKVWRYD